MKTIEIITRQREEICDITPKIRQALAEINLAKGALLLFCPHTTCGLTINERADPAVKRDLMRFFQGIAPQDYGWEHSEGNSDAHIRASLLGASLLIPVEAGELRLGVWQAILLYEGDGPRQRQIWLQPLPN